MAKTSLRAVWSRPTVTALPSFMALGYATRHVVRACRTGIPLSARASSICQLRRVRGWAIVMTNAALGLPPVAFWRACTAATMSAAAQTSNGLG